MNVLEEPKIDCHAHVFDPVRFPYVAGTPYAPSGHEIATADTLAHVQDAYGIRHTLLVGPNSGYGEDNRCLLDAITRGRGRFKGVAVVPNDISREGLRELRVGGVVGVACNLSYLGVERFLSIAPLCRRLEAEGMWLQLQFEGEQLLPMLPVLAQSRVRILVDHAGRPAPAPDAPQNAFDALLALGRSGRAVVKLSGYAKFSQQAHPHEDVWPHVRMLMDAFTADNCVWGSDWPFLRASTRTDLGTLLRLASILVPDDSDRHKVMWDTPSKLFGFGSEPN